MSVFDWLRRMFRRRPTGMPTPPPPEPPFPDAPPRSPEPVPVAIPDAIFEPAAPVAPLPDLSPPELGAPPVTPTSIAERSQRRRDALWESVGTLDPDVLGHLISPGLMGGPYWPTTRQAYRVVRRADGKTLIATDGLSDPFDPPREGRPTNGFECELFIETADLDPDVAGEPGVIDPIKHSWAFELLSHVAGMIAQAEGATRQFERHGVLSMEVPGVSQSSAIRAALPPRFVTADDALGVLLGGPAPDFPDRIDMPLSPVRLIPVVILTAAELGEVRAGDGDTRDAIVAYLARKPTGHRSSLTRPGIVDDAD